MTAAILYVLPVSKSRKPQTYQQYRGRFQNYPNYAAYSIRSYCYDARAGVHAIEVGKGTQLINLWLFYPGINGEINSIAVYGSYLQGHLNAIRSSMTVFGMPVESVDIDRSGMSDFVDIYLEEY